jgi:hypothetical protein
MICCVTFPFSKFLFAAVRYAIYSLSASLACAASGAFQNFYEACLARGMKPSMAHLILARKIAAITLLVWKKGNSCIGGLGTQTTKVGHVGSNLRPDGPSAADHTNNR